MAASAELILENGFMRVVAHGTIDSFEEMIAFITPHIGRAIKEKVTRVLLDERKLAVHMNYGDMVALGDYFDGKGVRRLGFRAAVLVSEITPEFHWGYETVAVNRSLAYKPFTDEKEALDWLLRR